MSYAIRRDSPAAKNPDVKTLYIWIAAEGEFAYTSDLKHAQKFLTMMPAVAVMQAAKVDEDDESVKYTVVEV